VLVEVGDDKLGLRLRTSPCGNGRSERLLRKPWCRFDDLARQSLSDGSDPSLAPCSVFRCELMAGQNGRRLLTIPTRGGGTTCPKRRALLQVVGLFAASGHHMVTNLTVHISPEVPRASHRGVDPMIASKRAE
jgi:hypothetical protein